MIIAFGHRKQQGKDTAVDAILKYVNSTTVFEPVPQRRVRVRSFAQPLYDSCKMLVPEFKSKAYYDLHPEEKEIKIERIDATPRQILIGVGQTLKSILGNDCFAISLLGKLDHNEDTLITDLRFPCEVDTIKAHGGVCVKVVRPGFDVRSDYADDALIDWDGWDYYLVNDSTKEDLARKAVKLYKEIVKNEFRN